MIGSLTTALNQRMLYAEADPPLSNGHGAYVARLKITKVDQYTHGWRSEINFYVQVNRLIARKRKLRPGARRDFSSPIASIAWPVDAVG